MSDFMAYLNNGPKPNQVILNLTHDINNPHSVDATTCCMKFTKCGHKRDMSEYLHLIDRHAELNARGELDLGEEMCCPDCLYPDALFGLVKSNKKERDISWLAAFQEAMRAVILDMKKQEREMRAEGIH